MALTIKLVTRNLTSKIRLCGRQSNYVALSDLELPEG